MENSFTKYTDVNKKLLQQIIDVSQTMLVTFFRQRSGTRGVSTAVSVE
jgi:hypothetical protein